MEITLKNVKTFRGHEGMGVNATMYIDGVKTLFYMDDASGAIEGDITVYNNEKFNLLNEYINSLPEEPILDAKGVPYKDKDGKDMFIKPNIDMVIDEILKKMEIEKLQKRLQKRTITHLVCSSTDGSGRYAEVTWGKQWPIDRLMETEKGYDAITKAVSKLKAEHPDWVILNENITEYQKEKA